MPSARSSTTTLSLLGIAALLAACSSDRPGAATEPFTGDALSALPTDCSTTALSSYAKTYFGAQNNAATNDIKALGDACKAYNGAKTDADRATAQASANTAGFAALGDIAGVAGARASVTGAPAAGGNLVVGVLGFMSIGTDSVGAFSRALSTYGMFAVRDMGQSTTKSRGGRPEWRIKATWPTQVLVYGFEQSLGTGGVSLAAADRNRYEISRLPVTSSVSPFVAYCADEVSDATRIQHRAAGTSGFELLTYVNPTTVCNETVASAAVPSSMFASLARRVGGFFTPADLYAAAGKVGGVGGFGSDLSPFFVSLLDNIGITFTSTPVNGFSSPSTLVGSDGGSVKVRVTTSNVAIKGAVIVLSVASNNGTPAGATLSYTTVGTLPTGFVCPANSACEVADANGVANFSGGLSVNKPGGFMLSATAFYDNIGDGNGIGTKISAQFQIQQPK